jgi:hypothetical protein
MQVMLQSCGLVQHMQQKVKDLHDSIGRKVARVAAALGRGADGGAPRVQAQGASMVWPPGDWQRGSSGGSGKGPPALGGTHSQQLQQPAAGMPWPRHQQHGAAEQSSSAPELHAFAARSDPPAALPADLARRASSRALEGEGAPLQQQRSGSVNPSIAASAGSGGSGGSHGSRGAGPPLVPGAGQQPQPLTAAGGDVQRTAMQLMEIMRAQLRRRGEPQL